MQWQAEAAEKMHSELAEDGSTRVSEPVWTREEHSNLSFTDNCFLDHGLLYRRFHNRDCLCVPDLEDKQGLSVRYKLFQESHDSDYVVTLD